MIIAEALSDAEMAAVRGLRRTVFIEEQQVPEDEEWDGRDDTARHLLARVGDEPAGTLRWRVLGETAKIERVCVARAVRGRGLGQALMIEALRLIRKDPRIRRAKLGAQLAAIPFYTRLGFAAYGPVYPDAGIDHRDMVLDL